MLKKVLLKDIKIGMFIHDLHTSWWKHSFVLPKFLIDSPELLQKVQQIDTSFVTIDESKSKYFQNNNDTHSLLDQNDLNKPSASIDPYLNRIQDNKNKEKITQKTDDSNYRIMASTKEKEMQNAKKIVKQTKQLVIKTMDEVRTGKISSTEEIYNMSSEMVFSITRNTDAMLSLAGLKTKDDYTFMHCVSVGIFMIALGKKLKFNETQLIEAGAAGLMHDLGKAFIPLNILNKPGKLTEEEFKVVRGHPELGYQCLKNSNYDNEAVLSVVRHHHERLDGQGYPLKLQQEQLTQLIKMSAIADVYDAVTSQRCYNKVMPATAALKMLLSNPNHFDSDLVKHFISVVGFYPNNSLVRLSNDKLAIVSEQNENQLMLPKVNIVFSITNNYHVPVQTVDLSKSNISIVSYEEPDKWKINMEHFLNKM